MSTRAMPKNPPNTINVQQNAVKNARSFQRGRRALFFRTRSVVPEGRAGTDKPLAVALSAFFAGAGNPRTWCFMGKASFSGTGCRYPAYFSPKHAYNTGYKDFSEWSALMNEKWKTAGVCLLAAAACVCAALRLPHISAEEGALTAAGFVLPAGAAHALQQPAGEDDALSASSTSTPASQASQAVSSQSSSQPPASSQQASSSGSASSAAGTFKTTRVENKDLGNHILETDISTNGKLQDGIYVSNKNKNHSLDVNKVLGETPPLKIKRDGSPMVLLYHTHTTEAYAGVTRTRDGSKSVVAVGNAVAKSLEDAGFGVIHDATIHDDPAFNGSYTRSAQTMRKNLKKYPSIQVTIDIHRDTMTTSKGTRYKPTVVVNGKKACQIMIISGCDDDGTLDFPNWEQNLRLAVRLQKGAATLVPNLMRPLNFGPTRYNEQMTPGSLLVEFGTEVNTLDEAVYSGELFGKVLAQELIKLAK